MVFERPLQKKRDKVGGSVVRRAMKKRKKKKFKETSAECELSEVAAQLN